jgi:hypothetical protein
VIGRKEEEEDTSPGFGTVPEVTALPARHGGGGGEDDG